MTLNALSSLLLDMSRDGDSATSKSSPFQWPIILSAKNFLLEVYQAEPKHYEVTSHLGFTSSTQRGSAFWCVFLSSNNGSKITSLNSLETGISQMMSEGFLAKVAKRTHAPFSLILTQGSQGEERACISPCASTMSMCKVLSTKRGGNTTELGINQNRLEPHFSSGLADMHWIKPLLCEYPTLWVWWSQSDSN